MRHAMAGNRLNRNSSLRKATVRDLAKATLVEQRICTTKAKAKEARKLVEKLITLGKRGTLADRRRAFAILCDHRVVSELFEKTAPRFRERNGGYTRIISLSLRRGDKAQLAYLELTEKDAAFVSKAMSSATSKVKELNAAVPGTKEVRQSRTKEKDESAEAQPETKTPTEKPGKSKPFFTKPPTTEKGKPGKQIMGGIKKMFQRKTGSE